MLRRRKSGELTSELLQGQLPIYAWADAVENKLDARPEPDWARELLRRREERRKWELEAEWLLSLTEAERLPPEDRALTRSPDSPDA
jgi:hypothetical protein